MTRECAVSDFAELRAIEQRLGPRLDPEQCGRCPVCRLGSTIAVAVGAVVWATCEACDVFWSLGERPFNGPQWTDQTDEEMADAILFLSTMTHAAALTASGDEMTTGTIQAEGGNDFGRFDFDPWPRATPGDNTTPNKWYWFARGSRARLFGICLRVKTQPGVKGHAFEQRVREELKRQKDDPTTTHLLRQLQDGNTDVIGSIRKILDTATDSIAWLEHQRAQIDGKIAQLKTITGQQVVEVRR